jgi:hypothetical protein
MSSGGTHPGNANRSSSTSSCLLTVVHNGFEVGSEVLPTISQGWPHVLSNLKTLLETGAVLPTPAPASEVTAGASS